VSMCGVCWFDGRSLSDEIDDLRIRIKECEAERDVANARAARLERALDFISTAEASDEILDAVENAMEQEKTFEQRLSDGDIPRWIDGKWVGLSPKR